MLVSVLYTNLFEMTWFHDFSTDILDCSKINRHGRTSLQQWNFKDKKDIVNLLKIFLHIKVGIQYLIRDSIK